MYIYIYMNYRPILKTRKFDPAAARSAVNLLEHLWSPRLTLAQVYKGSIDVVVVQQEHLLGGWVDSLGPPYHWAHVTVCYLPVPPRAFYMTSGSVAVF